MLYGIIELTLLKPCIGDMFYSCAEYRAYSLYKDFS